MAKEKLKPTKFVLMEKRSKKEQREFNRAQRGSWNGVNPVSKVFISKKHKKDKYPNKVEID